MASYLNIVFYNTSHLSLVPVLGSLGASLGTVAPVHGFRPFGGHHHVHDLGGGQTHIFLGGAFTQQGLTFVNRPYTLNTGRSQRASSGTISASANKIFKKSKAGWIFTAVGKGSISLVRPQQIIARNSMGSGGGRVWVWGSHFVRYVKMPNSLLLTRSELPVVIQRSSAGSSLLNRVKHQDAGEGKEWWENIRYIHSHCSWDSLSMRTPSVKNKTKCSVRVGRHGSTHPIVMTITHPPFVLETLGMHHDGARPSTFSLGQKRMHLGRFQRHAHHDKDRDE